MNKRIIALLLVAVMVLALGACSKGTETTTLSEEEALAPLTKDDVIKITTLSHASWPYNEDWKVWEYIEEGCGATLEINAIPSVDTKTKYPLMFSSPETLPDLVTFEYKPDSDVYAVQGAFVALDDLMQYMPNYKIWLDSLTDEQIETYVDIRKAYDGKIYYAPVMGREANRGMRAWLYREDIFTKHGLSTPTTFDELYDVSKKLKSLYPDSFPFAMRSGITNLGVTGSSWKEYWEPGVYYDYATEEWKYGASEEILLEMLTFYKKMVDEGLMPADFITMNTNTWQEIVSTSRGFIFPEFQTRIGFFNSMAHENNPEFNLTAMEPPIANKKTGSSFTGRYNYDPLGYAICNHGDAKRNANAAKYLDWLYTDEAMELCSWGKEGETYEIVDGKKQYIRENPDSQVSTLYGFTTHGSFLRFDPEATEDTFGEDLLLVKDMIAEHTLPKFNPATYIAFTDDESKVINEYSTALKSYSEEMISKFILGQEPLSNFDAYLENIRGMNIEALLEVYEASYNRVK